VPIIFLHVAEVDDEMPTVLERGVQCVLIGGNGSSDDGGKGDGGEGGAKPATRKVEADPSRSIKEGPTDEELEALMGDKDKIKSMERRINLLKTNQVYLFFQPTFLHACAGARLHVPVSLPLGGSAGATCIRVYLYLCIYSRTPHCRWVL
jgi:hypothetical protein